MKKYALLICVIAFALSSVKLQAQIKSAYKIEDHIALEGEGGWDYLTVDASAGLLYVSHGTMVQVVDVNTRKEIATIAGTSGVHGIAIADATGKGYISCGRDSTVVIFDIKTFKTLGKIKVNGANPDAILYDPFSKNVFVFNGRSNNVTVIETATDKIIGGIALDGNPEFAVTDEQGKVYLNIEDKSKLCVINSKTLKVEQYWPLSPAEEPSGLAIDNAAHILFSVSDKHMVVVDALRGRIIATLPIGNRVDGVAFDTGLKRAYSANGDGTMTVVAEVKGHYEVIENVSTQKGARTIAVDSKTHHIYLPTAGFGEAQGSKRPSVHPGSFIVLDISPVDKEH